MERELRKKLRGGCFSGVSEKRSAAMRAVKSRGNRATEGRLRGILVAKEIRGWRMHAADFPGTPDFFFTEARVAVFVDGCFWHGCPKCIHIPHTRSDFWRSKIDRNKARDREVTAALSKQGYKVLRFWECDLQSQLQNCLSRLMRLATRVQEDNN